MRCAGLIARGGRLVALSEAASIYPGVQNLLLTARALGLGANITTWHLFLEHEWKAALGIPRQVEHLRGDPGGLAVGASGRCGGGPSDEGSCTGTGGDRALHRRDRRGDGGGAAGGPRGRRGRWQGAGPGGRRGSCAEAWVA